MQQDVPNFLATWGEGKYFFFTQTAREGTAESGDGVRGMKGNGRCRRMRRDRSSAPPLRLPPATLVYM